MNRAALSSGLLRGIVLSLVTATAALAPALAEAPRVRLANRVNPVPRPYQGRVDVTTRTTIYFEVVVPTTNGAAGEVDTDTLTATLVPAGGSPVPMLLAGQVFASGFSGTITPRVQDAFASDIGDGVYIVPDTPLDPNRGYTVEVFAETLDGQAIDPASDSWSFTTRPAITNPTVSWSVNLGAPTVHWDGWFFTGILKPDFNTSRLFDQLDSYDLMSTVTAINPDAWSLQRDWPLTSDYWHNGVFDGNPNPVREIETRQITAITNQGPKTLLTVTDLEEAPLYGIAPNRPLGDDYHAGDIVTIGDREKFETAEVVGVDENKSIVKVTQLTTPPASWILDYPGSHPPDNPDTPDNFTLPLCYLRKMNPVGTPVYYWSRIDDEWDIVHGQHGRRLQVNFSYTPLDLALEPVPGSTGGHGSISRPKDWSQWHDFVREIVFHLIDRYGAPTQDFYYSVGNENNFEGLFWKGGRDGFYQLYDYTVNAVLTAFEDRGLDPNRVQVGGIEAAHLGGIGWIRDALYHCSGLADKPGGGIIEQNFVCADPAFNGKRAARVESLCNSYGGKGSPIDFVSIHEYQHASQAVSDMTRLKDDALAMDPVYYNDLNITSFENTPDWIPRADEASRNMFRGSGYFPTWAADWMHRMVVQAESDARYARHEAVLTVWPFDYNGSGQSAITGLIRVDDDGDGTEDRISTIKKGIFNFIELLAHLNRDLDALPARTIEGIRFGAVRSPSPDVHRFLIYNHDKYDTESSDETAFAADLHLAGVPWDNVTVRRWRVDRDNSSPYHAFQSLPPGNDLYSPAEVAPLEASDDLVEEPPEDFAVAGGAVDVSAPLRVNGVTLLEVRERDLDGDGVGDGGDNCPMVANPGQTDVDQDGRGASCDCDDVNGQAWALPGEAEALLVSHDAQAGVTTLEWQTPGVPGGTSLLYDTIRSESAADFDNEPPASCLESDDGADRLATDMVDPAVGAVFHYLVRPQNGCGNGPMGMGIGGVPRVGRDCP